MTPLGSACASALDRRVVAGLHGANHECRGRQLKQSTPGDECQRGSPGSGAVPVLTPPLSFSCYASSGVAVSCRPPASWSIVQVASRSPGETSTTRPGSDFKARRGPGRSAIACGVLGGAEAPCWAQFGAAPNSDGADNWLSFHDFDTRQPRQGGWHTGSADRESTRFLWRVRSDPPEELSVPRRSRSRASARRLRT